MIRTIALAAGLALGGLSSQAPEFTQQYLQRLAGQVDALTQVALDFDRSALAAGLGREEALAQMTGTDFLLSRQADMRRTFARHARLSDNLMALQSASPVARLAMPLRLSDPDILTATWADFSPAVPISTAGLVAGGAGFVTGWALLAGLAAALFRPRRRARRAAAAPAERREPVLRPVQPAAPQYPYTPLMGDRR